MTDDNINRLKLTFEQAEGVAPLPRQLELQEVSPELRAQLWQYIHDSIVSAMKSGEYGLYVGGSWQSILRSMHVDHYHRMIDDFVSDWGVHKKLLRRVFQDGSYTAVFGFLQWILRHRTQPSHNFSSEIDARLARCRSAYRVVNGNTIVPVSSPEEKQTLDRAFADLASTEFNGARQHLKLAAERATAGDWAGSVRESISAVESTVKCIDPDAKELRPALAALEKQGTVHGSLRQGFLNLYGYTSDEKGVRHSLLKDDAAKVDQTEALFMLGACAAFVSYLINKGRGSGLISK